MISNKNKQRGFTLLELMIVVLIIGILAAVSIPIYRDYSIRGNRIDATKMVTEIMAMQQRYANKNRTYAKDLSDLPAFTGDSIQTENGYYNIKGSTCDSGTILRCVKLTATPVAGTSQVDDGPITLNSRGKKQLNSKDGWDHRKVGGN